MAFDFLGTFNASQLERLAAFLRDQVGDVPGRIAHLTYEKQRLGSLAFEYDGGGNPTGYTVSDPKSTYIGGLVASYRVLGGNVTRDLQVRRMSDQGVYRVRGTDTQPANRMSNGEVVGTKGLGDGASAELVRSARSWAQGALHYRREYLERKIRRALDYADQIEAELALLTAITGQANQKGSLENTLEAIRALIREPEYRAIYDDKGKDPDGRKTYAMILGFSRAGSTLETDTPGPEGRDLDGYREEGT